MEKVKVAAYFKRIGLEMPETIVPDSALLKQLEFLDRIPEKRKLYREVTLEVSMVIHLSSLAEDTTVYRKARL